MARIAIIPARSGSKGLLDKNIKLLCGKPLLAYTIEAAQNSGVFDRVHVSTDSERYAEIARSFGADVPFLREASLSTDTAGSWDVVRSVLNRYDALGEAYDFLGLLQPTTPLRTAGDLAGAYDLLKTHNANAVVSVCETDHPPLWTDTLPEDGNMLGFVRQEYRVMPRQQLPKYYRVNGAIYLLKRGLLERIGSLYDSGCYAYRMSRESSVDIDDATDFLLSELLMRRRMEGMA